MVKSKYWALMHDFDGAPKPSDYQILEEETPPVGDGQFLVEALAWSVDPYQKAVVSNYFGKSEIKFPFRQFGYQVAKVLESKNAAFPIGTLVVSHNGWCTHSVLSEAGPVGVEIHSAQPPWKVAAEVADLPITYMVGILGMPGMTAYFGLTDVLRVKKGDVLLVTGAAGAVGSTVGQLGRIAGATVIGFAGSDDKVGWLKELGFHHAFNYKTADVDACLAQAAPKGINCYFDNVGGGFANKAYEHMAADGVVAQCGAVSSYNEDKSKATMPDIRGMLIGKRLTLAGFNYGRYLSRFPEGIAAVAEHIKAGRMVPRETKWKGFEAIPTALVEMLQGANTGKAVVEG